MNLDEVIRFLTIFNEIEEIYFEVKMRLASLAARIRLLEQSGGFVVLDDGSRFLPDGSSISMMRNHIKLKRDLEGSLCYPIFLETSRRNGDAMRNGAPTLRSMAKYRYYWQAWQRSWWTELQNFAKRLQALRVTAPPFFWDISI